MPPATSNELKVPVSSYTEWDALEEVIVGRVDNACFAPHHQTVTMIAPEEAHENLPKKGIKKMPQELIDIASKELHHFIHILEAEGITVRRPDVYDFSVKYTTPYWSSSGYCNACPRDGFLVIGDEIIETPMAWRSRFFEAYSYHNLFREYFDKGARWTAAPKPKLQDTLYKDEFEPLPHGEPLEYIINESEIVFDAADFMRCGRDIFCQLSNVTNQAGIDWLSRHLGSEYKIHILDTTKWRNPMHIDATFVPLKPGIALINPDEINLDTLPDFLKKWKLITAPKPNITKGTKFSRYNMCCDWLSANVFSIDENRIIVEAQQTSLINTLQKNGFQVIPCDFEHYSPFGGAFHCATLDVRRTGKLESYF